MSEEFKKELKIINAYGTVLEKYAGYSVINEKRLPCKKKDIKEAIKMIIAKSILANNSYDPLITGYSDLGRFQKHQDISDDKLLDPDPKKYLKKRAKHKKIVDKYVKESKALYEEINLLVKVMKDKVK